MLKVLSAAIGLISGILGIIQFLQEPPDSSFQLKNSSLALSSETFSLEDPVGRFQVVMNKILDKSSTSKHFKNRKELSVSLDYGFLGSVNLCTEGIGAFASIVECNLGNMDHQLVKNVLNVPLPNSLTTDLEISYANQTDSILKGLLSQRDIIVAPKSRYHLSCRVDFRINANYEGDMIYVQNWSDKELYSCELQKRNKVLWSSSESMTIEKLQDQPGADFASVVYIVLGAILLGTPIYLIFS